MRTFVLWARKAKTTANFSLDDLPGSGRMDLVCRCISNALCTSDHLRKDTRIYVILEGPPTPPITLLFDGGLLQQLDFDERSIAQHIQNALRGKTMLGVTVQKKSFEKLAQETGAPLVADVFFDVLAKNSLKADPIHPNADGYRIVESQLRKALVKLGFLTSK